jgi:NTE family protein
MKALVLSGGGARGAYEAGVASALLEREDFDLVCGVSIGAINAALICTGRDDALERFWLDAFPNQVLQLFPHVPPLRRVVEHLALLGAGTPWQNALRIARAATELRFLRNLGRIHKTSLPEIAAALQAMLDFRNRKRSLLAGATNVSLGTAVAFHAFLDAPGGALEHVRGQRAIELHEITEENFILTLLASAAMPGLFSPIQLQFDGESAMYADGCIVYNSPLGLAIDTGATEVTVLFVDPEPEMESGNSIAGFGQMAANIVTLWQQRVLDYELRLAEATNEIVRLGGASERRLVTIRHVRPERPLDLDILGFDDAMGMIKAFEQGRVDGAAAPRHGLLRAV